MNLQNLVRLFNYISLFCKMRLDPKIKCCSKHTSVAGLPYFKISKPVMLLTIDIGAAFTNYSLLKSSVIMSQLLDIPLQV
jgi:hypothetical protein